MHELRCEAPVVTGLPARLCKIPGCAELEVDQRGRYAKLCQAHADEQRAVDRAVVPLTEEQQVAFLAYVGEHPACSVREACEALGLQRRAVRALRRSDQDFDADYHEARGLTPEKILAEMRRRAIDGVEEPVFHDGEIVGTITKYSDRLLMALGKGFVPELRERVEVTGRDGGDLEVTVEHDFGSLLDQLRDVGLIGPGSPAAVDAPPAALLPARPD